MKGIKNVTPDQLHLKTLVKHLTYEEIRDELDHLYKLKQAFQLMKMRIKNSKERT